MPEWATRGEPGEFADPTYGRAVAADTAGSGAREPARRAAPGRRAVVDHALQRRASLADLRAGRIDRLDACDASPYLQRAAERLGLRTERPCPVCSRQPLWEVLWVYGEAVGDVDGSARTAAQVAALARERPDFAVYRVEVCRGCDWNHLVETWRTGTPGTPPARRSRTTAADP